MQLNEIHNPETEHASVSLKVILLIFAIVLVGVLGYLIWDFQNTPDTNDYSAQKITTTESVAEEDSAVACGDEAYAYELTFGNQWNGYKITQILQADMNPQPGYAIITCYFTMPTTSVDPVWTVAASDHAAGYASVFAVSVYTPAQWLASQEEANKPTELGHNVNYYWGWSQAQAVPTDLEAVYADAKNVVATFKIAP